MWENITAFHVTVLKLKCFVYRDPICISLIFKPVKNNFNLKMKSSINFRLNDVLLFGKDFPAVQLLCQSSLPPWVGVLKQSSVQGSAASHGCENTLCTSPWHTEASADEFSVLCFEKFPLRPFLWSALSVMSLDFKTLNFLHPSFC